MSKLKWKLIALLVLHQITITLGSTNVSQRKPDLAATTAKVIRSCYGDRIKDIGLVGNVSDSFVASFFADDPISVVLLKTDKNAAQNVGVSKMDRYKLPMFAVTATTTQELHENLVLIKNSRWWNHMAQFYIFDSRNNEMGCSEASGFLWTAWTMDILGAKFICNNGEKEQLIYVFNPYTQNAPAPWKIERIQKGVNNHPWTLFVRKYYGNQNICKNIDFDQTKDAGGYVIRLGRVRNTTIRNPSTFDEFTKIEFFEKQLAMVSRHMNVKFETVLHSSNESVGFVTADGKGAGLLGDLVNDRSDIITWAWPLSASKEILGNYPIQTGEFFSVTQQTGYSTQWEKIISAIDYRSRIGVCIVAVINVIFLKYALRQSFMIAILNTVRMVCNSCFTKLPNNVGPRIYLACLLFFVVTVQALYQGQLAALLAKQVRYPNIDNERDLVQSSYVLYGYSSSTAIFSGPAFKDRFIGIKRLISCVDFVVENSSIACVALRDSLIYDAVKSKLHISKYPVASSPVSWPNRINWPLQDRFTRHNFQYVESGLYDYHQKLTFADATRALEAYENKDSDRVFKILTVEDLNFAFVILGFGLGCAFLTFLIEIIFFKRRKPSRVDRWAHRRRRNQNQRFRRRINNPNRKITLRV